MNNSNFSSTCNDSSTHFAFFPSSAFDKFTGVLMIFIIVISLVGNALVCYAFLLNPRLRVVTNYFIFNLAISDIVTSALVISFDVDSRLHGLTHWKYGATMCKIWTTLYIISVPTSVLTLCVVSTDRYKAISDPVGYRTGISFSGTKALCMIAGIWAFTLFLAFLPIMVGPPLNVTLARNMPNDCPTVYFCYFEMSPAYSVAVSLASFILPSIIMATLYLKMYIIISNREHLSEESVVSRTTSTSTDSKRPPRSFHVHYQTKLARHFAMIVVVQLICWYPYTIESIVYNLCHTCDHISSSAQFFLLTIGYSSCAINPYLYAYQQRSFRQVFNKMLRKTV